MAAGLASPGAPARRSLFYLYSVIAILALALALRLFFVFSKDALALFAPPNPDTATYQGLARGILSGTAYGSNSSSPCVAATYFAPPLYPFFLAAIYKLFGLSNNPALVAQAILGALTALAVAGIAGKLFGREAFLMAGILAATHPYLITESGEILTEALFVCLYTVGLLLCATFLKRAEHDIQFRFPRSGEFWTSSTLIAFGAGVVLGAAILCRPAPLVGLPILVISLALVVRKRPILMRVAQACVLMLGAILVVGPWILRIHSRCGAWVPVATTGEFMLYVNNSPGWAEGVFLKEGSAAGQPSNIEYYKMLGNHPPGWFAQQARQEISADWGRFIRLSLARAGSFLKVLPARRGPPVRFLMALWTYSILFPLGIVGLVIALVRRQPFAWVMFPFLVTMCLIHIASVPTMRYRVSLLDVSLLVFLAGWLAKPLAIAAHRMGLASSRSTITRGST